LSFKARSRTVMVAGSSIGGGGATGLGAGAGLGAAACVGALGLTAPTRGAGRVTTPGLVPLTGALFPGAGAETGLAGALFTVDSGRGDVDGRAPLAGRGAPAGRAAFAGRVTTGGLAAPAGRGVLGLAVLLTCAPGLDVPAWTGLRVLLAGCLAPALAFSPGALLVIFSTISSSLPEHVPASKRLPWARHCEERFMRRGNLRVLGLSRRWHTRDVPLAQRHSQ
jgi:hypothetical protein